MKTRGEIEAATYEGITRVEQEYTDREPKDIHAYLIGDLLLVRLKGVLTPAEQQLAHTTPSEKGLNLLKQAIRRAVCCRFAPDHEGRRGGKHRNMLDPVRQQDNRDRREQGPCNAGKMLLKARSPVAPKRTKASD